MGGVELHTPGCLCREEIPGGSFLTGGFRHSARAIVIGRSIGGWLPVSCPRDGQAPLPIIDIAVEFAVSALVPINQPTSQTPGLGLGERASRASEVVIAGSAWASGGTFARFEIAFF